MQKTKRKEGDMMNFEEIESMENEEKIKRLRESIENDTSYWKKILLLMSIESEDSELLDLIIENKRKEIDLLKEKYKIKDSIEIEEIKNIIKGRDFFNVIEKIVNGTQDDEYAKASLYVLEILNRIPREYYDAISKKFIIELQKRAQKTEKGVKYNNSNLLKNISQEGIDILALINNKFWEKK